MDCAEKYIKFSIKYVLDNNKSDIEYLSELNNKDLIIYLYSLIKDLFSRCTYTDAITLL